jgi:hypothetical protein
MAPKVFLFINERKVIGTLSLLKSKIIENSFSNLKKNKLPTYNLTG